MQERISNRGKTAKRERFEKVASARVQKVIHMLELLRNCSNSNNYEYDSEDVELMFSEINKAVRDARLAYLAILNKRNKTNFSFEDK